MNDHLMESFIEIEVHGTYAFVAGQPLEGVIHLHAQKNLNDTDKITINLVGEEYTAVRKKEKGSSV